MLPMLLLSPVNYDGAATLAKVVLSCNKITIEVIPVVHTKGSSITLNILSSNMKSFATCSC